MAERKIFAGARLKRLRQRLNLTQTQMAAELGVSPSYLNLIERNQRPLTVQVLLKLSSVYGIDVAELSAGDTEEAVEALREVFADPLLTGEIASPTELSEFAETAPNAARGMTRLFEAYRESLERLSDLSHSLATSGEVPGEASARVPMAQVAAYFEEAGPFFPALEEEAEALAAELSPRDDAYEALKAHLKHRHRVELRILPDHVMPNEQLRFDRHTLRLFISERVSQIERPFLVARQIAFLGHRALLDRLATEAGMTEPEAARIARNGFARRLAEAVLAPGAQLVVGGARDGLRPDPACTTLRASTLARRAAARGARRKRRAFTAAGLPCDARSFRRDDRPDRRRRLPAAKARAALRKAADLRPAAGRAVDACRASAWRRQPLSGGRLRRRRPAVGSAAAAAPALDDRLAKRRHCRPRRHTGRARRGQSASPADLCERLDCGHRHTPPVAQPSAFYEHVVGPSDYELAG